MTVLACHDDARRRLVRDAGQLTGIDFVEVDANQTELSVYFLGRIPEGLAQDGIRISGGRSARDAVAVAGLALYPADDPAHDDVAVVYVDKPGDFSTYTLSLEGYEDVDPRYASADFAFKANCPSELDCKPACPPALPEVVSPDIDYLTRDYAGFRRLLLDRLALTCPDWTERHIPDIGMTLVELLAYAGDYLSYYQEAVATEAYIGTARRRISVRRHARLVDYRLSEGCNARAFVAVEVGAKLSLRSQDICFITRTPALPDGATALARQLERLAPDAYELFEPLVNGEIEFRPEHNAILIHDWGQSECCLSAGATSATLQGQLVSSEGDPIGSQGQDCESAAKEAGQPARSSKKRRKTAKPPELLLQPGDILIFEEVIGPKTGNEADADPAHRQAVRLTQVTPGYDALMQMPLVQISWAEEDALRFDLCLSALGAAPECERHDPVSVVRGNIMPVDHGRRAPPEPLDPPVAIPVPGCCDCEGLALPETSRIARYRPVLDKAPLTFAAPADSSLPASALAAPDPRMALPAVTIHGGDGTVWTPAADLLEALPTHARFVVEMEEDGRAHLRFGDGMLGMQPKPEAELTAHYRIGNGPAGNVGAGAIGRLVHAESDLSNDILRVRNPIAATGGQAREPIAEALLSAPFAYRFGPDALRRAIVASDYAQIAERDVRIQSAACRLNWSGSWYVADVGIDLRAVPPGDPENILADTLARLEQVRRIGHDLSTRLAEMVPIDLAIHVCVAPGYFAAHVRAGVLNALSSAHPGGFFHPDSFSCGTPVRMSAILAAVHSVPGVASAHVTRLQRQFETPAGEIAAGLLEVAPWEVATLANDRNWPARGVLKLELEGGR